MSYECEINLEQALDWQRSKAPILQECIKRKQAWYEKNHCEFWNDWVADVFNLETANEFGLSVWSIILDEPLFGTSEKSPPDYPAWGFGQFMRNFGRGNFGVNADIGYNFTLEQKRIILLLKAYILHMSGVTPEINKAMARTFGKDQVVCLDNLKMGFVYVIRNPDIINFIREVKNRDLLPRPASVKVDVVLNGNVKRFGFGSNFFNFGRGNFITGEI